MTHSLSQSLGGGSPAAWAEDFLRAAQFPVTPANVQTVYSWEFAESGGGGGMWNPLNTTQTGYPGETPYNDNNGHPVQNYARREDGIAANAKVIRNGYYKDAVAAFERGDNAQDTVNAITRSPWGTRHIMLIPVAGYPVPPPAPVEEIVEQLIGSPHAPAKPGRSPAALWSSGNPNVVAGLNGCKIKGASVNGVWKPPITAGAHGVGIFASVSRSRLRNGKPDGKGVVLQDSAGATFLGLWDN